VQLTATGKINDVALSSAMRCAPLPGVGEPTTATGIPVFKVTEAESQRLLRMEDELHRRGVARVHRRAVLHPERFGRWDGRR
jgi:hypothetical protein